MTTTTRQDKQHDIEEKFYDNGKLHSRTIRKKGTDILDDIQESYYENGKPRFKALYKNDDLHAVIEYDKMGNLAAQSSYKNDKLDGEYRIFYPSGRLKSREKYKKGLKNGISEKFYINGTNKVLAFYKNNKLDGNYTEWYGDGKLSLKATYKNGKLVEDTIERNSRFND